jgi:hypothetical protein
MNPNAAKLDAGARVVLEGILRALSPTGRPVRGRDLEQIAERQPASTTVPLQAFTLLFEARIVPVRHEMDPVVPSLPGAPNPTNDSERSGYARSGELLTM